MAVTPRPIKCGAALPDGGQCQEYATVTHAEYVSNRKPEIAGATNYLLKEIRYRMVCPTCGERDLVDKQ